MSYWAIFPPIIVWMRVSKFRAAAAPTDKDQLEISFGFLSRLSFMSVVTELKGVHATGTGHPPGGT